MTFAASNLHLDPQYNGEIPFRFNAGTDTMAQVAHGADYFNNVTSLIKLTAGDYIFCKCADGNMLLKVSAVNPATATSLPGSVVVQWAGGDMPINTLATGTGGAEMQKGRVGYMEVGTSIATATRVVLPTPYPGAVFAVRKIGSGTQAIEFDAGASASDVSYAASGTSAGAGGGTAVTYDGTVRRITLKAATEGFEVRATSTSRWRIHKLEYNASAVSEGGSVVFLGT